MALSRHFIHCLAVKKTTMNANDKFRDKLRVAESIFIMTSVYLRRYWCSFSKSTRPGKKGWHKSS